MTLLLIHYFNIPGNAGISDRNDGSFLVHLSDGTKRLATPEEIAAAQALFDAAEAARIAAEADKAELRAQFKAAADRLQQITDAAAPTNAQVVAAVRDLAAIQRKMLRALYALMT